MPRGKTLDFAFESKSGGQVYIGEMKCELEYQNYRFLTLDSPEQLDHHNKEAFALFLDAATDPGKYLVKVAGKPRSIRGSILVWGRCTERGRTAVLERHGLHDVLSIEAIVSDLITWQSKDYSALIGKYQNWSNELFSGLHNIGKAQ